MDPADLYCRISSLTAGNAPRISTEVAWIASRKIFSGVRANIALSGDFAEDPDDLDLSYLNALFDLLVPLKLKCSLGIGGEGPPFNHANWKPFVGGVNWTFPKRPPSGDPGGTETEMCQATADVKSQCIDLMASRYKGAGLDPAEYCMIELGNEPAKGGAGAPGPTEGYWDSGDVGEWDSEDRDPNPASSFYTTFLEYFNVEYFMLDTQGIPLISPTFTAKVVDESTNGLTTEMDWFNAANNDWYLDISRSAQNSWGLNCYYSSEIAEVALGPERFTAWAIDGHDNRRSLTADINSVWSHLNNIRAIVGDATGIIICEAGINPVMAGMTEDLANRLRKTNFYDLGRMRLAYLDGLRQLPVRAVMLFTATDSDDSSLEANQFGVFSDQLGSENDQTYGAEIAFGIRAGFRPSAPFAGSGYILGDNEVLPPLP